MAQIKKSKSAFKRHYKHFMSWFEKYLIVFIITFFLGGIFITMVWPGLGKTMSGCISSFANFYSYIAPLAIFVIIAPSLAKLLASKTGRFGGYAVKWLATGRLLACIWGVIFTAAIFGLPLHTNHGSSFGTAVLKATKTILTMAYSNPYMIAIWVGIAVAVISLKVKWLFRILEKMLSLLEESGNFFVPAIPIFMFATGAYIYNLSDTVTAGITNQNFTFNIIHLFGFTLDPNNITGMISIYFMGSLLVGLACFIWHFLLLIYTNYIIRSFSIKDYFKKYWVKVYPLLWATSSEALATPLNLYLTKKNYPEIRSVVRRLVVGLGSYLNINGTLICVFVLGGVVTAILGIKPSVIDLLFAIPIVFLLGYAIPGIPGELILFAGPLATLFSIPVTIIPIFLALYIGLQIGLPDSFRTGANSTDNCVCALLLNRTYLRKFSKDEDKDMNLWEVVHSLPGRIRLTHPYIYEGNGFNSTVEIKLKSMEGVRNYSLSPITGSVLVYYDTTEIKGKQVLNILKEINPNDPYSPLKEDMVIHVNQEVKKSG